MNVWFLNHYAVPPCFYPLARPYNFAKFLIKKGHVVSIFAASTVHNSKENLIKSNEKYKIEKIDDIKYIFIKSSNYCTNGFDRIKNMFQYTFGLLKYTKYFSDPDVILATSVHPLTCVAGIKIAKMRGCKCVVEIADLWPLTLIEMGRLKSDSLIAKFMYRMEHWIYKNANKVIFTMEGCRDYIDDRGWSDIDLSKIYYINNGVDLERYNSDKLNEKYCDDDLNDDKSFKVLYTGSMGMANSLNYLIKAAKIINDAGIKDIKILLFGDGYQRDELERYAEENKIYNVIFKGKIEKKYIPYVLSKSSLNVFTGKHIDLYKYGLSLNKMFDYMASGKPTLSNIECGYDMLEEYNCGLTVRGGSAEALAEGILKFYNMPKEEYKAYCQNALKAAQDFDFKVLTDKLEKVILEE